MALFQKSVLNKYLREIDDKRIAELYSTYSTYFLNLEIQQNIRDSKEEQFQEGFLRELFVNVLGYVINPNPDYNLTTELKNETGAKKADGAILVNGKAIGVIELKSTSTKDLESIRQQAFDYKANQSECVYVVTSNFEKLRFYIDNAVDYEEFDLFTLSQQQFKLLYLCLHVDSIMAGIPKTAKTASLVKEENVTKKLYADYSVFKEKLFNDIISKDENIIVATRELAPLQNASSELAPLQEENPNTKRENDKGTSSLVESEKNKEAKLILFKKTQKLMDRFLFIFFAEDRGLIPPNTISTILTEWEQLKSLNVYVPLYTRFKNHFDYINAGWKGDNYEIFAYNGGLFLPDEILDNITISDEVLYKYTTILTKYDFDSEVDVNILGHIFEHSLNEIETMNAELEGQQIDLKKSKRKKDGVFYTPKYITKYIVDNTIGKLCEEKKEELSIVEDDYLRGKKGRKKDTIKQLEIKLTDYRDWLLKITVVDPACGSGAFLNQALEFLIREHRWIDEMTAKLFGGGLVFQDVENSILENNLYGVDINEESVEIAKLSLWLRTAQKGRKLTSLNNNIKCGNSLIDDPEVAGDKAFKWEEEFPKVFPEKQKKAFHITWVTHNSRTSQRMMEYKVNKGDGVWLTDEMEVEITKTIIQIVEEDNLNVMAYNICGDHVHILLVCEEDEIPNIVRKMKGKSSQKLKEYLNVNKSDVFSLWAQKYSKTYIEDDEKLNNTIIYIANNRTKHNLPLNKELQNILNKGLQPLVADEQENTEQSNKGLQPLVADEAHHPLFRSHSYAFRPEYKGGFDVVIGNPPYVQIYQDRDYYNKTFITSQSGDLYALFFEKGINILKENGIFSFITPSLFIKGIAYQTLRDFLLTNSRIVEILDKGDGVFSDVQMPTAITTLVKENVKGQIWNNYLENNELISKIINSSTTLSDLITIQRGFEIGKSLILKYDKSKKCLISGSNVERYLINSYNSISEDTYDKYKKDEYYFDNERLLIRETGNRITVVFAKKKFYHNRTLYSIKIKDKLISIYSLLGILNSNLNQFYYKTKFASNTNIFPKIRIEQVKELPIKLSEYIRFEVPVKIIISLKGELQKLNKNFLNLLQSKYDIDKLSTKLQNWYELDFKQFIAELKKKKVVLSLSEEAEWMSYFNEKKTEAQELKAKIDKTDNEIDLMVYRLYDLTYDEVLIVDPETKISREVYGG